MMIRSYLITCHVAVFLVFMLMAVWHILDQSFLRWEFVVLVCGASLPFLLPLMAIYIKGVGKDGVLFQDIGLHELMNMKHKAEDVGLLSVTKKGASYSFQVIAVEDPNLALAGLRIEIEKRLVRIAESHKIDFQKKGVGMLLRLLVDRQLLSSEQRSVLEDMLRLLNSAIHGAKVTPDAVTWAMSVGPDLLQSLDEKAKIEPT